MPLADMASNRASSHTGTKYIIRDHHCYCDYDDELRECKFLILFLLSSYFISHCKSEFFPTSLPGFVEFPPIFASCMSHAGQKAGTTICGFPVAARCECMHEHFHPITMQNS